MRPKSIYLCSNQSCRKEHIQEPGDCPRRCDGCRGEAFDYKGGTYDYSDELAAKPVVGDAVLERAKARFKKDD